MDNHWFLFICHRLAWAQIGGHSVIPKSVTSARIRENFNEVTLSPQDIAEVESVGKVQKRYNVPFIASEFPSFKLDSIGRVTNPAPYVDKPRWDVNIFGDDAEKDASHHIILWFKETEIWQASCRMNVGSRG